MTHKIQQLVDKCRRTGFFEHRPISLGRRIDWGTVNECWVLECESQKYLARIGRPMPAEFLSTWHAEQNANQIAAKAGLAPMPVFVDEGSLSSIYPWCGDPFNKIELTPSLLIEVTNQISKLHGISAVLPPVSYRQTIENYLRVIGDNNDWIRYSGFDLESLLAKTDTWDQSSDVCFCHHDLNLGNILWDGSHCTLVDWEYARLAHPLFDLASLSKNFLLSDSWLELLLDNYDHHTFSPEEVRSAEVVVSALERLWLEAANVSLFDKAE